MLKTPQKIIFESVKGDNTAQDSGETVWLELPGQEDSDMFLQFSTVTFDKTAMQKCLALPIL